MAFARSSTFVRSQSWIATTGAGGAQPALSIVQPRAVELELELELYSDEPLSLITTYKENGFYSSLVYSKRMGCLNIEKSRQAAWGW